jgi:hypothetical protein
MEMAVYRFRYTSGGGRGTPYHDGNIEVKAGDRDTAQILATELVSKNTCMGPSLVTLVFVSERP